MADEEIKQEIRKEIKPANLPLEEEEITDEELEEKKRKRIPWNIFYERNGVFIVFFLLCVLIFFSTIFRIIFHTTMWSIEILAWHIAFILIYILFAPCIVFFKKFLALIPAIILFLCTVCLVGFYPFEPYMTAEFIKNIPVLSNIGTLIPLTEISETTFKHWQIIYNILIVPITVIFLLFHRNPPPENLEFFYEKMEITEEDETEDLPENNTQPENNKEQKG